jgi:hypothetical protein
MNLGSIDVCLRYKREKSYTTRIRMAKKPRLKEEGLKEYIVRNPCFNTNHMGEHFNMKGSEAHYWLKKLDYTYKKTFTYLEANIGAI